MAARETLTAFSGTWVCPSGVVSIAIECYGAGGSGGINDNGGSNGSSGGGGGAYSKKNAFTVVPGQSYTYQVGQGGVAASGTNSVGHAGDDTWFNSTGTVLAKGGSGGTAGAQPTGAAPGGAAASGVGDTKHSGGASGSNNGTVGSGGGGPAGDSADGSNGTFNVPPSDGAGGNGGTTSVGTGSAGISNSTGRPTTGVGAGSGNVYQASATRTSSPGGNGQILLTYVANPSVTIAETAHAVDAVSLQTAYGVTAAETAHAIEKTQAYSSFGAKVKTDPPTWSDLPKTN